VSAETAEATYKRAYHDSVEFGTDAPQGIPAGMSATSQRLSELGQTIDVLLDRLKPILGPERPHEAASMGPSPAETSRIAEALHGYAYDVHGYTVRLDDAIRRLDL
jgi:hypothetical protein